MHADGERGQTESEGGSDPAGVFERHRERLFGIAYRMLASVADAEDVLQTAYLRWHEHGRKVARNPEAWLVAVATRLSIDRSRLQSRERQRYVGDWLPEPIRWSPPGAEQRTEMASDLSLGFLLLLERLSPEERAALLLRDVFEAEYSEVASVLERSEAACRQLVHRSRERLRAGERKKPPVPPRAVERLVTRFLAGLRAGDEDALLGLVSEDAEWISDGGGNIPAARNVRGASRIVRFQLRLAEKVRGRVRYQIEWINGEPALVTYSEGRLFSILSVDTDGDRLLAFYCVLNPDKLRRLPAP